MKPANGIVITDELREELDQAAVATQQAYLAVRAAPGIPIDLKITMYRIKMPHKSDIRRFLPCLHLRFVHFNALICAALSIELDQPFKTLICYLKP